MTRDRRFWPATEQIAHESLAGTVDLPLVKGELQRISAPCTDLCAAPCSAGAPSRRDKQLLYGQSFVALDVKGAWVFGFDPRDSYVGYVWRSALDAHVQATDRVSTLMAHVYTAPDLKSPDLAHLPFGALVSLKDRSQDDWLELTTGGWVSRKHLAPLGAPAQDWVHEAERFLGVAYLWGGNSCWGIDCSGLVQVAMYAAGMACPRDSDLQEAAFKAAVGPLRRGDLVFWQGHVGIMADGETLLHANAYHMAVAKEPLATAIKRIGEREFRAVTKYARP